MLISSLSKRTVGLSCTRVGLRSVAGAWRSFSANRPHLVRSPAEDNNEQLEGQTLDSLHPLNEKLPRSLYNPEEYHLSRAWQHPMFTEEQMAAVPVAHKEPEGLADKIALKALQVIRWSFDKTTGYTHPPPGEDMSPKYKMSPEKWLQRFVFLESIAGVPGMVGGMVRHLHSLRLLRRDRAWIETLLEEAYNERMHLLTFIKMTKPGWFLRLSILGAQGVFFNSFFIAYLIYPRLCHRFVGYLEEEAVLTYTRCINELEAGMYPEWQNTLAPDIALEYWKMPEGSNIRQLLYYIRADEAKHREVNHTLGNLNQNNDPNPYALKYPDSNQPHPTKGLEFHNKHPVGWDRKDIPIS